MNTNPRPEPQTPTQTSIAQAFEMANNLSELRKIYYAMAMQHHPDKGGNQTTMQFVNNCYEFMFTENKNRYERNTSKDKKYENYTAEQDEMFKDIISKLLKLRGLFIEICGCWLWISGDTKPHKETLKDYKCYWSHDKKKWYWKPYDSRYPKHKRALTMDEIRGFYGSENIRPKENETQKQETAIGY